MGYIRESVLKNLSVLIVVLYEVRLDGAIEGFNGAKRRVDGWVY